MSVGPLRRLVGTLGLIALAPTAAMLMVGRIDATTAALRALATLLAAMLIGRVAGWWVGQMARGYEDVGGPPAEPVSEAPRRRRDDAPSTA
jgi:hypothetical protein